MSDICHGNIEKTCGIQTTDSDNAIECEICNVWHHINCQNLNISAYRAIHKFKLFWVCDRCKIKCLQVNTTSENSILKRFEALEEKFESKLSEIEKICKKTSEETPSQELWSSILKRSPSQPEQSQATKLIVKEVINEQANKINRDRNVVIYNCNETTDRESPRVEDINSFLKIASYCETTVTENDIENAHRIGHKLDSGKPRPLLISLQNIELKKSLMKNTYKLRQKGFNIFVNHDRSKEERLLFKTIREQRKKLEEQDVSGEWFFKIRGPPWALRIVKEKKRIVESIP